MTIEEIHRTLQTVGAGQADHEARLTKLEDSFKESFQRIAVAIEQLTQLATVTDGRLDDTEEKQIHTDARLDALIDSQIQLLQRVDALAAGQARNDDQIAALVEAVGQTSEQIRQLLARDGDGDGSKS